MEITAMPNEIDPIVDNWYSHLDKGQRFYVVAVDAGGGLVEIQHFDGDLEEIEYDEWYGMDIVPCEAPENWSGPSDIAEQDDYGTEITDTQAADWSEPLQELKKPQVETAYLETDKSSYGMEEDLLQEEPLEWEV
jgi:hypothetical protein